MATGDPVRLTDILLADASATSADLPPWCGRGPTKFQDPSRTTCRHPRINDFPPASFGDGQHLPVSRRLNIRRVRSTRPENLTRGRIDPRVTARVRDLSWEVQFK